MSEVLRPRIGGDGEGEGGIDLRGVEGVEGRIGEIEVAVGDIGVSRRSGGDRDTTVALESCIVSKACMRAFTADEAMMAATGEVVCSLRSTSSTSWAGERAGSAMAESGTRLRRGSDAGRI